MIRGVILIAIALLGLVGILWLRRAGSADREAAAKGARESTHRRGTVVPKVRSTAHRTSPKVDVAGASIAGRVIDDRGAPVSGANVAAWSTSPRRIARSFGAATTGADGSFRITALPAGAYQLQSSHDTLVPTDRPAIIVDENAPRDGIVIAMSPGITVTGRVVDRARHPVAGARVSASSTRDRTPRETISDDNGVFRLRGVATKAVSVTATIPNASSKPVPIEAGRDVASLELVLDQLGTIGGIVVQEDGTPARGVEVTSGSAHEVTDDAGRFTLSGLSDGRHHVAATRGRAAQRRRWAGSSVAETGTTDLTIVLTAGDHDGGNRTVRGIVTAADRPVANAEVQATVGSIAAGAELGARVRTTTVHTNADGMFLLAGLGDGELLVAAGEPSLGRSRPVRVSPASDAPLVLELEARGALSGRVERGGRPVEAVRITAHPIDAPTAITTGVSGRDGRFRFSDLAPGRYRVSAVLGTSPAPTRSWSTHVELAAGADVNVDIAVEPGDVTLDVIAVPREGPRVSAAAWIVRGRLSAGTASAIAAEIARGIGESHWTMIRGDRAAVFPALAPGEYTVCVVPLPAEVEGFGSVAYLNEHADTLAAFCQPVAINAAPNRQRTSLTLSVPTYVD